jgi:hypothetical protein
MNNITRRNFLRQLGVSAATVPFVVGLDSLYAKADVAGVPKKRFIFMYSPNGNLYYSWRLRLQGPDVDISDGKAFASPNLIMHPLAANASKLLVLDRLSWIGARGIYQDAKDSKDGLDHPGGHQKGMGSLLTGTTLVGGAATTGNAGLASGISVDQVLATQVFAGKVKFPSLEVGVQVNEQLTDRYVDKRLSYDGSAKPRTPANDPFALFHDVFGSGSGDSKSNSMRAFMDKSVLDAAVADFNRLQPKLSTADRQLLQQHSDAIRGIETQFSTVVDCGMIQAPTNPGVMNVNDAAATHTWAMTPANFPLVGSMMTDIIVQAVACGLTNVVTFQWANSESDMQLPWIKEIDYTTNHSGHHGMSHARDPNLVYIDQWYATQFNTLIERFKAVPDSGGSGTLLDNSLLAWSTCLGDASAHQSNNAPIVLAGSNGGYFKTGRNIQLNSVYSPDQWGDPLAPTAGAALTAAADKVRSGDQKTVGTPDYSNNDLMVSILNSFGVQTNTFGDPRFCKGALPGIKAT